MAQKMASLAFKNGNDVHFFSPFAERA